MGWWGMSREVGTATQPSDKPPEDLPRAVQPHTPRHDGAGLPAHTHAHTRTATHSRPQCTRSHTDPGVALGLHPQ